MYAIDCKREKKKINKKIVKIFFPDTILKNGTFQELC